MNKFAQRLRSVLAVGGTTLFAFGPALASIIDFEDATGPSTLVRRFRRHTRRPWVAIS